VTTVQDILNIINNIAADSLAESWDNVGLLIGSPEKRVTRILLALDPTKRLVAQAKQQGAELLITHHPAIFHPLKSLRTDQPVGGFIAQALQAGINVIGCHTNLDAARGGVSDVLAANLELQNVQPLVPAVGCSDCGLGRTGTLAAEQTPEAFINILRQAIDPPWLLEAGPRPDLIGRVAVCGGSCSDFAEAALAAGADVFITAEIKHAVARWAWEAGLWLIDGGHFATENPAMERLQSILAENLSREGLRVDVQCAGQKPPLTLVEN
jgi:dinuclear metal center YbgI/SA1388 family protein